jgi:hypothetical protein
VVDLRSLARLSSAQSRLISPENFDGAKGGGARAVEGTGAASAAHLGTGWKISPSVDIGGHTTFELAAIDGPALITHLWLTTHCVNWRSLILRAYWDSADEAAIEVPGARLDVAAPLPTTARRHRLYRGLLPGSPVGAGPVAAQCRRSGGERRAGRAAQVTCGRRTKRVVVTTGWVQVS